MQDITTATIPRSSNLDLLQLVLDAGPVSHTVLLILLGFSLVSWAIIFNKWRLMRKAESHSRVFLEIFRRSKKFSEVKTVCHQLQQSPLVGLFLAGYNELDYQLRSRSKKGNPESARSAGYTESSGSAVQNLESVARSMVRASNMEVMKLEKQVAFLATTGSATPFIGLFGTVWGIMNAFQRIGALQSADISIVAPGVSEALIATAAGLAAAIPAVIFYNHFVNRVRRLSTEMDDFALEYLTIIERNWKEF